MIYRAAILAVVLAASGCVSLGHKDEPLRVSPPDYTSQVRAEEARAIADMAAIGYSRPHRISVVDIRDGTVRRPKGWALPCKPSPTGFAGGWTESTRIVIVRDPARKTIVPADVRHEFKHAILNANFYKGALDAQHVEISRSEKVRR